MARPSRIHLGCGDRYWPGWINVDLCGQADVHSDVRSLPMFADGSIDEIQAIHVFEHLPRLEISAILREWHRVLKPDGRLVLEMPSMDKIARMIVKGEANPQLTLLGIFGDASHANPWMLHHWCYTDNELNHLLTEAGFAVQFEEPVFHYPIRDLRVSCRSVA